VGLEAFGVALDDPADGVGDEWGERLPAGLDVSWEATGPPGPPEEVLEPGDCGYTQPGRVQGDVLIGVERIAFDGWGWRSHRWGVCDWWADVPHGGSFMAADGTALSAAGGKSRRGPDIELSTEVLGLATVPVPGPEGRMTRLVRSLCRARGEGFDGVGWWQQARLV
jgi:hypothetical protein